MYVIVRNILIASICVSLSACSVVMASRSSGVNPKELQACKVRSCLIAAGAIPINQQKNKQGKLYSENFRATMQTGSAARAVMHGVLDVATVGIWEVAGTPIEGIKGKKTGYVIIANYTEDGNTIKHLSFEF